MVEKELETNEFDTYEDQVYLSHCNIAGTQLYVLHRTEKQQFKHGPN